MSHSHVLTYLLDGQGGASHLDSAKTLAQLNPEQTVWHLFDGNHADTRKKLIQTIGHLDPIVVKALTAQEIRPRLVQIGDGVLLILRGINLNPNAAPEDMVSVRLWVESNRIITVHRRHLKSVKDIEETLQKGTGPKTSAEFVTELVKKVSERIDAFIVSLDDETEELEAQVLESGKMPLSQDVSEIRKKAHILRRYMRPQKEAILQLHWVKCSWLGEAHLRYFQESLNHITRHVEDLDAIYERVQIVHDELSNSFANKMHRNTYMLSVIAAVFLPLSFLTGLLGINVGGIPGADNHFAFWIFVSVLLLVVCIQAFIFRKLKWF